MFLTIYFEFSAFKVVERIRLTEDFESITIGSKSLTLTVDSETFFLKFPYNMGNEFFSFSYK